MAVVQRAERLPHCSWCGGDLIISAVAPKDDAQGRPIHMELCAASDTGDPHRPAAGMLVQFFADGGGRDLSRSEEGAILLMDWTRECMAAHGWEWQAPRTGPRSEAARPGAAASGAAGHGRW